MRNLSELSFIDSPEKAKPCQISKLVAFSCLKTCVTEHFTHQSTIPSLKYPNLRFSSFLVEPLLAPSNRALTVIPHGGPHSAVIDAFNLNIAGFVRLGYSILVVNYRGSIGQGLSPAYLVFEGSLTSRFSE